MATTRRFQNLDPSTHLRGFRHVMAWQLGLGPEPRRRSPKSAEVPTVFNDGSALRKASHPSLTWIGHATYLLQLAGVSILTDPVLSPRLALIPRNAPPGLTHEALPPIQIATVSHNHRDHMDAPTLRRLGPSVHFVVPLGLGDWFLRQGLPSVTELDWWQSVDLYGVKITLVPSQHWSQRSLLDTDATLWGGFVYEADGLRAYHSGDTAYFSGFKLIGERCGPIDAAMLPIGAYDPRWFMRYQHMNPEDAVQAFLDLGARHFFAMHWGTFKLTDEPLDEPPTFTRQVWQARGIDPERLRIPAIGETLPLRP
ncbi:MAG: MBL fold metallo-hydrolase [Polyangiaceae bacterium]|jgi:L-ascorbate metabolism protein UlaG (beta-lactamase superfamily)|nr:MBL fold metallo-hydrolase [Polyangiaceae bacterium]